METISEKIYPVQTVWIFKSIAPIAVIATLIFLVNISFAGDPTLWFMFLIFVAVSIIAIVEGILKRSNFHYVLEDKFVVLHQGIISKQNRNIPYGRIQEVYVHQGLFERVFGLAAVTFDDLSQSGGSAGKLGLLSLLVRNRMDSDGYVSGYRSRHESIGFVGNKVHIPGLKKEDAEALKNALLQKVKENPIQDSQSGL